MFPSFERWPFRPLEQLTESQKGRWWQECFLPDRAYEILQNQPHWSIIVGPSGSGKSTLLQAMKHTGKRESLVVDGTRSLETLKPEGSPNLFYQMMSLATQELYYLFRNQENLLAKISQTQREYLRWLIEKFNGVRSYLVFVDGLRPELRKAMATVPSNDLYPTQTEQRDVQGQIDELVNMCRSIGYQSLIMLLDMTPYAREHELVNLANFLGWLEPMHHSGFIVLTAVTQEQYQEYELAYRTRGRVATVYVRPQTAYTRSIVSRHLIAATDGGVQTLEDLAGPVLAGQIEALIEKEFQALAPGPMVRLAEQLLEIHGAGQRMEFSSVRDGFFARNMPLRLDWDSERCGVWRGHQYISLEKHVFELLKDLARRRKTQSGQGYVHGRASKLRRAIEPDPNSKQRVYVKNTHDQGYWLENFVEN